MITLKMKTRLKWEGERLEKRIERRSLRGLFVFGGAVRRKTRTAMRKKGGGRKGHSRPGEPPRQITGILRDTIFFTVDRPQKAVTIATPQQFSRSPADVPGILEFGGVEEVQAGILFGEIGSDDADLVPIEKWERMSAAAQARISRGGGGRFRKRRLINSKKLPPVAVKYEPRPALIPAYDSAVNDLVPEVWEGLL